MSRVLQTVRPIGCLHTQAEQVDGFAYYGRHGRRQTQADRQMLTQTWAQPLCSQRSRACEYNRSEHDRAGQDRTRKGGTGTKQTWAKSKARENMTGTVGFLDAVNHDAKVELQLKVYTCIA